MTSLPRKLVLLLLAHLATGLAGCKATNQGSNAAAADQGLSTEDVGKLRMVWADGIEQVIQPAKDLPAIAQRMSGTWYCRAMTCGDGKTGIRTGAVVMSLKGAKGQTADSVSFHEWDSLIYGRDPTATQEFQAFVDNTPLLRNVEGGSYRLQFSDDKHGELLHTYVDASKTVDKRGGASDKMNWYTFEWVEDGKWLRRTTLNGVYQDEYDLLRIVNADGSRTANYDLYLKDFAAKVKKWQVDHPGQSTDRARQLFVVAEPGSDLDHPDHPVPPEGGRLKLETATQDSDSDRSGSRDGADDRSGESSSPDQTGRDAKSEPRQATGKR